MNILVTIEIISVEFRPLTSLEWAVLSLVGQFKPTPPSLEEATRELRLHEPAFLRSAFHGMRDAGAFESRLPDGTLGDLPDAHLSKTGREILSANGRKIGNSMTCNRDVTIDWPSGLLLRAHESGRARISPTREVSLAEIEQRLDRADLEDWLNSESSQRWRVIQYLVIDS